MERQEDHSIDLKIMCNAYCYIDSKIVVVDFISIVIDRDSYSLIEGIMLIIIVMLIRIMEVPSLNKSIQYIIQRGII